MSPDRKRKVLNDIGNVKSPKNRRKSLGFDMVSIGGEAETRPYSASCIADPPIAMSREINSQAEMHSRGSRIPYSLKQQRLLDTCKSLEKKSKIGSTLKDVKYVPDTEPAEKVEVLENELSMWNRESKKLEKQDSVLDQRLLDARRAHRSLARQDADLKIQLRQLEAKFESRSNSITQNISHDEQIAELKLREYEVKLKDEYSQQEFTMKSEIMDAVNSEDTELIKELETLTEKKEALQQQLEQANAEKEEAIRCEKEAHKVKLNKKTEEADSERAEIIKENERIRAVLNQLEIKLEKVLREKEAKEASLQALRKKIEDFKNSVNNPATSVEGLKHALRQKQEELQSLQSNSNYWSEKLHDQKALFETAKKKYENYHAVHRTLEDAILGFNPRPRTYVSIPAGLDVTVQQEEQLIVKQRTFEFSKVLYSEDDSIALNWESFVQRSLTQHNVSIAFSGTQNQDMAQRLHEVVTFLLRGAEKHKPKGWSFSISLHASSIVGNSISDLLHPGHTNALKYESGRLVEIEGKRTSITSAADIKKLQTTLCTSADALAIYNIKINAMNDKAKKNITNQLSLVDFSCKSIASQVKTIKMETGLSHEKKFLEYAKKHSKLLFVCEVQDINPDTIELLSTLSHL